MKKLILSKKANEQYEPFRINDDNTYSYRNIHTQKTVSNIEYWFNLQPLTSLKYMNYFNKAMLISRHARKISMEKNSYASLKLNNDFRATQLLVLE